MKRERRFLTQEFRVDDSGPTPKITGYAAVFNSPSTPAGKFTEIVDPHAFDACLAKNPDIVGLFNHEENLGVLGRTTSGTMVVSVDERGLKYVIDPPDTQLARDLMVSMRRGDVTQSSFGFYCLRDKRTPQADGSVLRTLLECDVFDCSPVVFPAYPNATAEMRSMFPDGDVDPLDDTSDDYNCDCNCAACQAGDHADCTADTPCEKRDDDDSDEEMNSISRHMDMFLTLAKIS
jgi:HK97 family phage prohead protease